MDREEFRDYMFYMIDLVSLVIAMIFSITDAYLSGTDQLIYKVPMVILAFLFKYIYLTYYAIINYFV